MRIVAVGRRDFNALEGVTCLKLSLLSSLGENHSRRRSGMVMIRLQPVRKSSSEFLKFLLVIRKLKKQKAVRV